MKAWSLCSWALVSQRSGAAGDAGKNANSPGKRAGERGVEGRQRHVGPSAGGAGCGAALSAGQPGLRAALQFTQADEVPAGAGRSWIERSPALEGKSSSS